MRVLVYSIILGLNVWAATGNLSWGGGAVAAIWALDAIAEKAVEALRKK